MILSSIRQFYLDKMLILFFFQAFFFFMLYAQLELKRKDVGAEDLYYRKYHYLVVIYLLGFAFEIFSPYLPPYIQPGLLLAYLLAFASESLIGYTGGIYFSILTYLLSSSPSLVGLLISLMMVCAGMAVIRGIINKKTRIYFVLLCLLMCILFSGIGIYYDQKSLSLLEIFYCILNGVMNVLVASLFCDPLRKRKENITERTYENLLQEDYPLLVLMKQSSSLDYNHALRVRDICSVCATLLGADASLAAAGGLYYRIGRLEGEPHVQNGLLLAGQFNFPSQLTKILGEFNGEEHLPSTIESAIVQIVDSVTTKFDVLKGNAATGSNWNREMIVYQTLNEFSAEGMYDQCGLSMNQFLKIRDYLVHLGGQ